VMISEAQVISCSASRCITARERRRALLRWRKHGCRRSPAGLVRRAIQNYAVRSRSSRY
jgi:hypothetical protein